MSTRSVIARPVEGPEGSWEGRYHHSDGYPSGVGKTLWEHLHGDYAGDIFGMLQFLIDDHPGGWSSINNHDWSQPPGFRNLSKPAKKSWDDFFAEEHKKGPACYCHGDRSEKGWLETGGGEGTKEWLYVIDPLRETFRVQGYNVDHTFPIAGTEPDWAALEAEVD